MVWCDLTFYTGCLVQSEAPTARSLYGRLRDRGCTTRSPVSLLTVAGNDSPYLLAAACPHACVLAAEIPFPPSHIPNTPRLIGQTWPRSLRVVNKSSLQVSALHEASGYYT